MSFAHGSPPRGTPVGAEDTLRLIVGDSEWVGWQRVSVTRSMDTVPASFDIQVTERYPDSPDVSIKPGDPCRVEIGGDLVITGYVDRYAAALGPADHTVRIAGRSKSQDLVDCAAFVGSRDRPNFQILGGSALSIAQALARPYDVEISSIAGPGAEIPQFSINFGETAWEIIDRVTRFSKLIAYDLPDGSVVMAQAGSEVMASGFAQGENVERAAVSFSLDERYSEYEGHLLSTMAFGDDAGVNAPGIGEIVRDSGVARFRRRYIISEQTQLGRPLAHDRAIWERNRRYGRSQAVNVTCDSWRDAAGALWAPNHQVPIRLPALKLPEENWLIAQITYVRDDQGQHGLLVLMPREAFAPEPLALQATPALVQDVEAWNAAAVR
jgi:prophage tail gpP-like protein